MRQQPKYIWTTSTAPANKPGMAVALLAPETGILTGTIALSG